MKYLLLQISKCDHKSVINAIGVNMSIIEKEEVYSRTRFEGGVLFDDIQYFDIVASIEADDLNQAFEYGQNPNRNDSVTVINPTHSVSVGDVLIDETGTIFCVEDIGFSKIAP